MKKEWKSPVLEVLDVSMTMKGWKHGHGGNPGHGGGGNPGGGENPDPTNPFGS
ncbi:paeninodin family lasso peptide [Oceanobacillus arenosus]|uniref:paeninodin family lasso peptide n=1 Tax=Oceanobacillus arenosus TaxID=1229153 RepID=UPI000E21A937